MSSPAPTPRQRAATGLGLAWSLLLLAGYGAFAAHYLDGIDGVLDGAGHAVGKDFVVFWSSAAGAAQGRVLDVFGEESFGLLAAEVLGHRQEGYAWVHPPPALFVVLPLAALPYVWAWVAWTATTFALYLLAARRVVLLCAPSTFVNAFLGQMGSLTAALYLAALRFLPRRPVVAGVCVGLLAIKPQLGLMAPVALLAARAWRTILAAAVTVVVLIWLSALAFGWDAWQRWLTEALPRQASYTREGLLIPVSVTPFTGALAAGASSLTAWLTQAACTAFAAAATWWAFTRLRRGALSAETAGAVLLLATCLATPYMGTYDLTLASPVALHALARWRQRPWVRGGMGWTDLAEAAVWSAVWMLPVVALLNRRGLPVGSAVLAAALGLLVWRAAEEVAESRGARSPEARA